MKLAEENVVFFFFYDKPLQPRISTSNLMLITDESDGTGDGTDKDNDFDRSSNSGESENKEMFKSQVTGRTKYIKRSKAKDDIDTAELEFLQTIGDRLKEKATEPQKDEESIFGDLIACQLRPLPYHERVMAKIEISNVEFQYTQLNYGLNLITSTD